MVRALVNPDAPATVIVHGLHGLVRTEENNRPLPMRGVRILPLELSTWSGEHVWPDELR